MPDDLIRASNFVPETLIAGGLGSVPASPQAHLNLGFYNGLSVPVTVITRTGVRYTIPFCQGATFRGFVIRSSYRWGHGVKVDTHELLNDQGLTTSQEASLLDQQLRRDNPRIHRAYEPDGVLDYLISAREFEQMGGSVYLENLDLTLSVNEGPYVPSHPFSLAGIRKQLAAGVLAEEAKGLSYGIRIVDRLGRFGDRYVNIGGEVFQIRAERNNNEPADGVYAVSQLPAAGMGQVPEQGRCVHYRFEDADKALQLYTTYNDAKTLGNPQDVYKRDLEERAHRLKLEDLDFKERKAKWERESDERKRVFETEQHEAKMRLMKREDQVRDREHNLTIQEQDFRYREAQLKRDTLELKDRLDNRSMDRKETIEILKHIPLLITGIGGIVLAIKKLKG